VIGISGPRRLVSSGSKPGHDLNRLAVGCHAMRRMLHQHPLDDMAPKRLPGLDTPVVEGIAGEQSVVEEGPG
jgi:hypothetical protein